LAFGIERLRTAWVTFAAEVTAIDKAVPFDRSHELLDARGCLAARRQSLKSAQRELAAATSVAAAAQERHWGRRDKPALKAATRTLDRCEREIAVAREEVSRASERVAAARQAEADRHAVIAASAPERARLAAAVRQLDHALAVTRSARVAAIASGCDLPGYLEKVLGPVPQTRGGQRVWCALASEIEARRDGVGQPDDRADGLWRDNPTSWRLATASGLRPGRTSRSGSSTPAPSWTRCPRAPSWSKTLSPGNTRSRTLEPSALIAPMSPGA